MSISLLLALSFPSVVDEPAIFSPDLAACASVSFTPSGDWLATGGIDGQVKLWSVTSCLGTRDLGKHDGEVNALAVSLDGRLLASGDLYRRIEVWSLDSRDEMKEPKRTRTMTASGAVDALAFSKDAKWLLAGIRDNAVLVFDLGEEATKDPRELRHDYEVGALAIAPDGKTFASGDGGGTVRIWSFPECHENAAWKHEGRVTALAYAKDGATLFVATSEPKLRALDVTTGKERDGFAVLSIEANSLVVDASGEQVFAGGQDALVHVIDAKSGKVAKKLDGHDGPITSVALSPDGSLLVSCGRDRQVRVVRLR